MVTEYLGPRASNAGDDFHEWWALRNALRLLNPDSTYQAIKVEGVIFLDNDTKTVYEWDAVDCSMYVGGESLEEADEVEIQQLKYSSATPEKNWTVSEFTNSKSKSSNNSIIKKLAETFHNLLKVRPDLISDSGVSIKFVSNRPCGRDLANSLSAVNSTKYERLRKATGLSKANFRKFVEVLDFSLCGTESRFAIEEAAIEEILLLTRSTSRGFVLDLKDRIHRQLLPEGTQDYITARTVITWLGVSDYNALFPCPPKIDRIEQFVDRNDAEKIANVIVGQEQFICIHGEGGSGKTTILTQIEKLLPCGSEMITYDCYGAGTYLDSDNYRHKAKDAYLQIINEMSVRLGLPLFINHDKDNDYIKTLKMRLEDASSVLKKVDENAILALVIDAADNSVTGANECADDEQSFIHELLKIGEIPENVCLIVTSRTGRLPSLSIPEKYHSIEIGGFSLEETASYAKYFFDEINDQWVEHLRALSNGNPRVQSYAISYSGGIPNKALDYLRPNGKSLEQIFEARFKEAILKEGGKDEVESVCAMLVALPSPTPIRHLASILELSESQLIDIFIQLPGIRRVDDNIGFLDEDIEYFVRAKSKPHLISAFSKAADYFLLHHETDEYCAHHLAYILYAANQGEKIIGIISKNRAPTVIKDQSIRREVYRTRLKIAMKVCRSAGKTTDAVITLLNGAEAVKADNAIDELIINNPDVSAHFSEDKVGRSVLYSSKYFPMHGRFLSHVLSQDVDRGDYISAREKRRLLNEWFNRRAEYIERKERESERFHDFDKSWPIEAADVAAIAAAILEMDGCAAAYSYVSRWRPLEFRFEIADTLIECLLIKGNISLVKELLDEKSVPRYWSAIFSIRLAQTGQQIDLKSLHRWLTHKHTATLCKQLIKFDGLSRKSVPTKIPALILDGCEILISQPQYAVGIKPMLNYFLPNFIRTPSKMHVHSVLGNDLAFRAFALIQRSEDLDVDFDQYFIDEKIDEELDEKEIKEKVRERDSKKREIDDQLGFLLDFYADRANSILCSSGSSGSTDSFKFMSDAVGSFRSGYWKLSREYYLSDITEKASLSIRKMLAFTSIAPEDIYKLSKEVFKDWGQYFNSSQRKVLSSFATVNVLQDKILEDVVEFSIETKNAKATASEKIEVLLDLCRSLIFLDKSEAREIFRLAVDVAHDVDLDVMHEVSLYRILTNKSCVSFDPVQSREIASYISEIIIEYGLRLDGNDNFPWKDAIRAVCALDAPLAMCLLGYWEECDLTYLEYVLPPLLVDLLRAKKINAVDCLPLLKLSDELSDDMLIELLNVAPSSDESKIIDEIARDEILRYAPKGNREQLDLLNSARPSGESNSLYWLDSLNKLVEFVETNSDRQVKKSAARDLSGNTDDELDSADENMLSGIVDSSPECFIQSVIALREKMRAEGKYVSSSDLVEEYGKRLHSSQRIKYIELLATESVADEISWGWAEVITDLIASWSAKSLKVSAWKKENMPELISSKLDLFARDIYVVGDHSRLKRHLEELELDDEEIVELLLSGVEKITETLDIQKLYSLIGLICEYCTSEQVAAITKEHIQTTAKRLNLPHKVCEAPESINSAIAQLLYSQLGDMDTRIRWRAAHAIRVIAKFGDQELMVELTKLYEQEDLPYLRKVELPFYWISARLWLAIALDRVADESPAALIPIYPWIVEKATDEKFPHVLMRYFLKTCLDKLVSNGAVTPTQKESELIASINLSIHERQERKERVRSGGFHDSVNERKFSFDSLDTLRYTYPAALRCFADVSMDEFLDVAEEWIVGKWDNGENLTYWENEPRKHRLQRGDYGLYSHSHGSTPTIERYSYYLEWNAMWCALGTLMNTRALSKREYDDDDFDALEELLNSEGLTSPPYWSSDIRGLKPLRAKLHFPIDRDHSSWVHSIVEAEFMDELVSSDSNLVVDAYYDVKAKDCDETVRISSALVSTQTALPLVRALQTSMDSHDYRIPPSGDDLEIKEEDYKLIGWITDNSSDSRIDKRDPFSNDVRKVEDSPSKFTLDTLGLIRSPGSPVSWISDSGHGMIYEAWSDLESDSRRREHMYEGDAISDGHRLLIDENCLKEFLDSTKMDLVVEIEITKRVGRHEYTFDDKEPKNTSRYARIYLLRGNGEICATEGCVGSWLSFSV